MTKIDARKQTRQALHDRRRQVISLYEEGVPVMQIVAASGMSWSAVNSAIQRYLTEGMAGLIPLARGRKQGTGRILTADQEAEIRTFIRKRRPLYFGLKKSLWDREAVQQLIQRKYALNLSMRVVGNYLSRWGVAVTRGLGFECCSADVRHWLDQNYKDIVLEAHAVGAEVYWLMAPTVIDVNLWRLEPIPAAQRAGKNLAARSAQKLSMAAAITNQGRVCWALSHDRYTPERQIKFVEALIRDARKKTLFLIRSSLTHYSSVDFSRWVEGERQRVRIFPEIVAYHQIR